MRIRSHIFVSVFLATVLPLIALALGATYYSEHSYRREVNREILTNLNSIVAEMQRELKNSRNLALGISRATALQAYYPILRSAKNDELDPRASLQRQRLNRYFQGFQTIIPGAFSMRVLDSRGDTLVKVTHQRVSEPQFESLSGLHYVEQQLVSPEFAASLQKLPRDEVSLTTLPHHVSEGNLMPALPFLDYALPIYDEGEWLGTLTLSLTGEQLDHILDNAPRLYKGNLMLVEDNPENEQRHGSILYDSEKKFHLAQIRHIDKVQTLYSQSLLDNVILNTEGNFTNKDKSVSTYYVELLPYPNRLIGWILATRIDAKVLSTPFEQIRVAIWLFAGSALMLTLILTGFGVRYISQPICQLASQLKSFADGNREQRVETNQTINEVKALSSAFNYMADTLIHAQQERDRAQQLMLQSNKLASIGQMAAGIGHEINNPLNNILSYTKLISRNIAKHAADLPPNALSGLQQDLDALREETLRASEIVRGILNFARQVPPQYSIFRVEDWLNKSIALINQTAKSRHIAINLHYSGDDQIEGDQAQLQQVMINLLLNAIQSSSDNSSIDIDVDYPDHQINVHVHDEGSGIAEAILDKIYDPFFTTKIEGEGSGLGLSITLGIVESHQGTLEIKNNPDKGVTATLTLPISRLNHD